MKIILTLLMICISISGFSKKVAIIIAVGDYPSESGWGDISSANDISLVKNAIQKHGFLDENIYTIQDAEATKKGIVDLFTKVGKVLSQGDILVVHISSHGQPIFDQNDDETDGLDESIIPYDAKSKYSFFYKGEKHLRDDELGIIFTKYRNTLGKDGQVLITFDSCHSGSAIRGGIGRGGKPAFVPENWKKTARKRTKDYSFFQKQKLNENAAPYVFISASTADEVNYEYNGFGSLSFAFSKAVDRLGKGVTYRQLFAEIAKHMNVIVPMQTPTVEGDIDYKLFNGDYVAQEEYFKVSKKLKDNLIEINTGKFNGIFEGSTLSILPSGTTKFSEDKVLAKGKITKANYGTSKVLLDRKLNSDNPKSYWVFMESINYGAISVKAYFDNIKDQKVIDGVKKFFNKNNLGEIVKDSLKSDVIIRKEKGQYTLSVKGFEAFNTSKKDRGEDQIADLNAKIFSYAQGRYIKDIHLENADYDFEFELMPVVYDEAYEKVKGEPKSMQTANYKNEVLYVKEEMEYFFLKVTNKSDSDIYFRFLEIYPSGKIGEFFPNEECKLRDDETKLPAKSTKIFKDCLFSFSSPYEKLMIKGFATNAPLNFDHVISRDIMKGSNTPLEQFLKSTYTKKRSSDPKMVKKLEGNTEELFYEIIE